MADDEEAFPRGGEISRPKDSRKKGSNPRGQVCLEELTGNARSRARARARVSVCVYVCVLFLSVPSASAMRSQPTADPCELLAICWRTLVLKPN